MDILSGSASAIAVVSLAIQLSDSIKELCVFIEKARRAPKEINLLLDDLHTLADVLNAIRCNEELHGPDTVTGAALKRCTGKVDALKDIVQNLVEGLCSNDAVQRKLIRVKAARRDKKIQEFKVKLEEAKGTLQLALESSASRQQRIYHDVTSQQLTAIMASLSHVQTTNYLKSESFITTSAGRCEQNRRNSDVHPSMRPCLPSSINPPLHHRLELELPEAVQTALHAGPDIIMPLKQHHESLEDLSKTAEYQAQQSSLHRKWIDSRSHNTTTWTPFGTFRCSSKTQCTQDRLPDVAGQLAYGDTQYFQKTSAFMMPSNWLVKCGFSYAVFVDIERRNQAGWDAKLHIANIVRDDAPIFKCCEGGDLKGVKVLLSDGLASVHDVNSRGETPLHVAAAALYPQLCKFLLEIGADRSVVTGRSELDDPGTPFMQACKSNMAEKIQNLLSSPSGLHSADPWSEAENCQIDTLRVFMNSGEDLDTYCCASALVHLDRSGYEQSGMSAVFSWFLQQTIAYAEESSGGFDSHWWAIHVWGKDARVRAFLQFCSATAARKALLNWILFQAQPRILSIRHWPRSLVKIVSEKAGGLHFIEEDISGIPCTPSSMALRNSGSFDAFRALIIDLGLNIHDFVHREVGKLNKVSTRRWSEAALNKVFEYEITITELPYTSCVRCNDKRRNISWWPVCEIPWIRAISRIIAGSDPDAPLSKAELREQEFWDEICQVYLHGICPYCYLESREQTDEILNDSPFLLSI